MVDIIKKICFKVTDKMFHSFICDQKEKPKMELYLVLVQPNSNLFFILTEDDVIYIIGILCFISHRLIWKRKITMCRIWNKKVKNDIGKRIKSKNSSYRVLYSNYYACPASTINYVLYKENVALEV